MAYGKHRHSTFYGEKGSVWNVEIYKDGFTDTSTEIDLAGEGFEITWNGQGGTRDRVFLGSECKLNCIIKNNTDETFLYNTLSLGYEKYFVRIYKGTVQDSNLWWFGWIQPAFDKIENLPFPYVSSITATDSYGFFKKQKAKFFTGETQKNQPVRIRDIFLNFIGDMKVLVISSTNDSPIPQGFTWLRTNLNWYSSPHTFGQADPALLYYVAKGFVSKPTTRDDDGNIQHDTEPYKYKESDVLDGVLKSFNIVGFLAEGHYNFIQPNNYADNTTGELTCFEYNSATVENPVTVDTLLTIDQSNNVILAGSSLNYEPSFERVTVNHLGGFSNVDVGSGQDMTSEFIAGSIQNDLEGQLNLSFFAKHKEKIVFSDFNFQQISGGPNPTNADGSHNFSYKIISGSFKTTGTLTIRLSDGSTSYYLQQTANQNTLSWSTSVQTISIERGYNANLSNPVNNEMAVGLVTNSDPLNNSNFSNGPCRALLVSNGFQKFETRIIFESIIEEPPIGGDIFITFTCDNDYSQVFFPTGNADPIYSAINDPTPTTEKTTAENITLIPSDNNVDNDVTNGITYTASQTNNISIEQFDLGDVNLGQSVVNKLYSFQYLTQQNSQYEVAPGFTTDPNEAHINASQLLVNEFLKLQVEPLEILQADIQSADISPLKLIKYSINNDNNFKYYSFLGGTFKAQSEILSGEWFKVNSISQNIITNQTPFGPPPTEMTLPNTDAINQSLQSSRSLLDTNSYGSLSSDLINNTTNDKIVLVGNTRGKIYNNQKLGLIFPNGTNLLRLTANGNTQTNESVVDVDSFTVNITYPAGSLLIPLSYDLTNVLSGISPPSTPPPPVTPGGANTHVQFNNNGSFGGTSLMTVGTDKITFTGDVEIQGSNEKIKLNSGGDIVIDDDVNGGSGSGGLLYRDSGGGLKFAFVVHPSNKVTICNRAANGEVQIRANTSTAGASGELTIATFKDTSVDFLDDAELRGTNIGNIFNLEAYLTAVDFVVSSDRSKSGNTATNGGSVRLDNTAASLYATFQVPIGYQATHVQVNGSSTSSTFDVYACDVANATATSLTSSPSVGTNQALSSAQTGLAGKYLSIKFTPGATTRTIYGAKITLARV